MPKRQEIPRLSLCLVFLLGLFYLYLSNFYHIYAQTPSNTVDFLYDGSGQRIYKGVNGGEHTYYVSPGIEVEINPQGSVSYRKNYYFSGKLVAVKDNSRGSEQVNYIHQDHLGSTSLVTSNTGQVVSQQVYFPYGSTRTTNGTLPTEHQYTSQISDQEQTGLYYYNARYYNPQIAKFTQADASADTLNKYVYVNNNPIVLIDPTGYQSACPFWVWNCLKEAAIEDWQKLTGFVQSVAIEMAEDPEGFTDRLFIGILTNVPQVGAYYGALYAGGTNLAESVDLAFCALASDPGMCAIMAQAVGPNLTNFSDDAVELGDELLAQTESQEQIFWDSLDVVQRDLDSRRGYANVFDKEVWEMTFPSFRGAEGLHVTRLDDHSSDIWIRNTGNFRRMNINLHHEYLHEIYESAYGRSVLPDFLLNSEIFVREQLLKQPYISLSNKAFMLTEIFSFKLTRRIFGSEKAFYIYARNLPQPR